MQKNLNALTSLNSCRHTVAVHDDHDLVTGADTGSLLKLWTVTHQNGRTPLNMNISSSYSSTSYNIADLMHKNLVTKSLLATCSKCGCAAQQFMCAGVHVNVARPQKETDGWRCCLMVVHLCCT